MCAVPIYIHYKALDTLWICVFILDRLARGMHFVMLVRVVSVGEGGHAFRMRVAYLLSAGSWADSTFLGSSNLILD